ncbi:MAG: hypothetical protein ACUZ8A_07170 [Candidatus Bathyanammoxibius sp.]
MSIECRHCGKFMGNGERQPMALCDVCKEKGEHIQVVVGAGRHVDYLEDLLATKRKQLDTARMQLVTLEVTIEDAKDAVAIAVGLQGTEGAL